MTDEWRKEWPPKQEVIQGFLAYLSEQACKETSAKRSSNIILCPECNGAGYVTTNKDSYDFCTMALQMVSLKKEYDCDNCEGSGLVEVTTVYTPVVESKPYWPRRATG